MAAPYWGNLDPPAVTRQNSIRRSGDGADRDSMQSQPTQLKPNRISVQSQTPTASTQSPFVSPTASSFQAEGLGPRPPSLPSGAPEGGSRDHLERRRRRASRGTEQYYDDSRDSIPPPAAPDVPRPPPISYKEPYNVVKQPTSYSAPTRSRSIRRSEGPIDADQIPPIDYSREKRSEKINGRHDTDRRELNTGGEYKGDRASYGGRSDDPNRSTVRRSAGSRREKPEYHESAAPPRTRKESTIDTETQRRREWAPDRSPLQRLELTLDSITKEEKRARAEEAELLAREAEAGRGGDRVNPNSVRFRNRPVTKGPEKVAQPNPQGLHETGQVKSLVPKQKDELQRSDTVEEKKPIATDSDSARQLGKGFEYQPQRLVSGTGTGTAPNPESLINTQHGKSFRERATLPINIANLIPPASAGIIRSTSNKLKKDPPGDPWFNRRIEAETAAQLVASRKQPTDAHRESSHAGGPLNSAPVTTGHKRTVSNITPEKQNFGISSPMEAVGSNSNELLPHVSVRGNSSKKIEQLTGHKIAAGPIKNILSQQQSHASRLDQPDEPGPKQSQENNGPEPRTEARTAVPPAVSEGNSTPGKAARSPDGHHHLPNTIDTYHHRLSQYQPGAGIYAPSQRLDEWKNAGVAALTGALLDLEVKQTSIDKDKAWWEANRTGKRSTKQVSIGGYDGGSESNNGMVFPAISAPATKDKESAVPRTSARTFQEGYDSNYSFSKRFSLERTRANDVMVLQGEKSYFRHIFMQSNRRLPSSGALNFLQTSFLSYSSYCPELSKHNIFHPFHICPVKFKALSKKLTDPARLIRVDSTTGPTQFKPPLFLKCGPLLRYCGMRQYSTSDNAGQSSIVKSREIWRGSVLIVTMDSKSSYEKAPILRLFSQPMDLLPPPPQQVGGAAGELAPEYIDPIAGLTKVGRDGRTLFVRPVEQLDEGKDLSGRDDFDDGIFEAQRSIPDPAQGSHDRVTDPKGSFAGRSRKMGADGEKLGKYVEVKGFRLHVEQGSTFWRFNIEVELQSQQQRIAYRINQGPTSYFWVPGQGQSMNIMFHSCNGFSLGVDPDQFSGPDPMWRDVLNTHQTQPFHVMIGGGDQIYNDLIMEQTEVFREWLMIRNPLQKHNAPFTSEMQDELEAFYFERYSMWFSQGLFGLANSQIPMVNILDDHDIIDGFGSYPHHFMDSPVFTGLGAIAFKYYMLFQHQSIMDEGEETEPSWLLGLRPGPYIKELSRSVFMFMGTNIAFLGLDCRTERSHDDVVSDETYTKVLDRLRVEIVKGQTKHLIVLLSVPIAYPRLVWLENILTSRFMDPIKAIGKYGIFGKLLNRFDGGVEILDDVDDHWTAKHHKRERNWLIEELQELAAEKSVRVTILGGDVHLAAVGQFYSAPKLRIPKDRDHRYMPNVISSAIVNTPPPDMMTDILSKRNKVHHLNHETDESMIPMFTQDVDGSKRSNKHLMPKRNWCSIREYTPDLTPSPTPSPTPSDERSPSPAPQEHSRRGIFRRLSAPRGPSYRADAGPPVSMSMRNFSLMRGRSSMDSERPKTRRSLSLSRKDFIPANLFRRGSKRRPDDGGINGYGADSDEDEPPDQQANMPKLRGGGYDDESYLPTSNDPPRRKRIGRNVIRGSDNENMNYDEDPQQNKLPHQPPPQHYGGQSQHRHQVEREYEQEPIRKPFHRVPTSLSERGRRFGGPQHEINLEGGLDICLNVEVNEKDPAGITVPYRLLVPALWYEGKDPSNHQGSHEWKGPGLMRLMSFRRGRGPSNASWKGKEREDASTEEHRDV